MEPVRHYLESCSFVGQEIEEFVRQYRKRRRAIPPDEFREMLYKIADCAMQYH